LNLLKKRGLLLLSYDVYFYEAFEEEEKELKRFIGNSFKAGFTWKTIQENGDKEPPAKIISLRTQSDIPTNWAEDISAIITRSTGYNHILEYRRKSGVDVNAGYLPLYCHRAVAEQALMLWMVLLRKLTLQLEQFKSFKRDGLTGYEAKEKTLLVVGVGNIGYEIVKIGRGLEMNVLGVDLVERHPDVPYISIKEGLKNADIIVSAMNLTEQNRGYFSYELLKNAKKSAVFVNVSRGELSPAADLLRLIEEKRIAAAALDVYNFESILAVALREGKKTDNPEVNALLSLVEKENVVFTPHNAFNTHEAVVRKSEQAVQQIMSFIENGSLIWPVENI
jgi:D-lactate dehydrogenase